MAATPWAHVEVAVATKCTGEETVEPLPVVETPTQAAAEIEQIEIIRHTNSPWVLTLILCYISSF